MTRACYPPPAIVSRANSGDGAATADDAAVHAFVARRQQSAASEGANYGRFQPSHISRLLYETSDPRHRWRIASALRLLRETEGQEIVITRNGKPAGVLIGFGSEEDWFDYRLENDPRFLRRIERARNSLREGRGFRIGDVE
jgi:PHD/YefM family antitoxin component YafN of YafNO toxin-antitoxin module